MRYRVYDTVLDSAVVFPELETAEGEAPGLWLRPGAPGLMTAGDFELVHTWAPPGGEAVCRVYRQAGQLLFEYPHTVRFYLLEDGHIHVEALAGCAPNVLRHLALHQAIPRWLGQQGALVLHASAVAVPGLGAFAFLGASGHGKSTLAAGLGDVGEGVEVLADDSVLLRVDSGGVRLFGPAGRSASLAGLLMLNEPESPVPALALESLGASDALIRMVGGLFNLDPTVRENEVQGLRRCAEVLNLPVPALGLAYPRRRDQFAGVLDALQARFGPRRGSGS